MEMRVQAGWDILSIDKRRYLAERSSKQHDCSIKRERSEARAGGM